MGSWDMLELDMISIHFCCESTKSSSNSILIYLKEQRNSVYFIYKFLVNMRKEAFLTICRTYILNQDQPRSSSPFSFYFQSQVISFKS